MSPAKKLKPRAEAALVMQDIYDSVRELRELSPGIEYASYLSLFGASNREYYAMRGRGPTEKDLETLKLARAKMSGALILAKSRAIAEKKLAKEKTALFRIKQALIEGDFERLWNADNLGDARALLKSIAAYFIELKGMEIPRNAKPASEGLSRPSF